MIDEASQILKGLDERTPVAARRGTFIEVSSTGGAVVDMGDSRFVCDFGAGIIPVLGETVIVLSLGQRHILLPSTPKPGVGTVMTETSGIVTVQTVAGEFSMPYVGEPPTSGDLVALGWSEGPRCLGVLTPPPGSPDPTPDPGAGAIRSAIFRAIDAGSTDRGAPRWWTAQPWASNTTFGAWFYGNQIKDTIPSGATLVSLEFYASWQQRQGDAPRFALHNQASKGGVPGYGGYTPWSPNGGWQVPPDPGTWFTELKAGGPRLGIGLNQGGYNKFSSLAQDSMSGALRISWRS